jgi:hypothetical protein
LQSSSGQKPDRKKTDGKIDKEEGERLGGWEVGRVKKAMVEVPYNKGIEKFKMLRGRLILGEETGRKGAKKLIYQSGL